MDLWRRSARKLKKEKVKNSDIRNMLGIKKNFLVTIEQNWSGYFSGKRMEDERMPKEVLQWEIIAYSTRG